MGRIIWAAIALTAILGIALGSVSRLPADTGRKPAAALRVGAYYFGGWSDSEDSLLLKQLTSGRYGDRKPLFGWLDREPETLHQQLQWARGYGIDFLVFEWAPHPERVMVPALNSGLQRYRALADHAGVGYALLFSSGGPADVSPADWAPTVESWVTGDFQRPDYERVDGRPLLVVLNSMSFRETFGGPEGARKALRQLQAAARSHGLPGVYVVGSASGGPLDYDPAAWVGDVDGFDALTSYSTVPDYYVRDPWTTPGPKPFSELISTAEATWEIMARVSPRPYLPPVTLGWDARPAGEPQAGRMLWFERRPADVEALVRRALAFMAGHPSLQTPGRPVLLLQAWNELSEGAYLVPTAGAGHAYGEAVARALGR